ncbi:MAG: FkbM family methyltransferase [Planctomycetota bacterium]
MKIVEHAKRSIKLFVGKSEAERNAIGWIRKVLNSLVGRDILPRTDCRCRKERFGSEYGGYDVAVDWLDEDSIVYSFGIGEDATFDLSLIERFGLRVHAFDPTPKSLTWIKQQGFPPNFMLHEYGLADFDGQAVLCPAGPGDMSHTVLDRPATKDGPITGLMRKLTTIMKELKHDRVDLLKMDIEGAEYGVIENIAASTIRPRQILIEFHHRFADVGVRKTREAMRTLREMGYALFSVSPHTEYGFIHRPSCVEKQ